MRIFSWGLMMFGFMLAFTGLWAWLPFVSKDMRLDFTGVVFFVIVGTICFFIGNFLEKRIPVEKTKVFVLNPNDISFIIKALNKEKKTLLILGFSLLIFDAIVLFAVTHGNEGKTPPPIIIMIIGIATMLLILGVGFLFLYKSFKLWRTSETRAYKILKKTPHVINGLTVYFIQKEGAPGKVGLQILAELSIKEEKSVELNVSEEQLSLLTQYVKLHNPSAFYFEKELSLKT